jgi:hypothetical protein
MGVTALHAANLWASLPIQYHNILTTPAPASHAAEEYHNPITLIIYIYYHACTCQASEVGRAMENARSGGEPRLHRRLHRRPAPSQLLRLRRRVRRRGPARRAPGAWHEWVAVPSLR